jgi:hypothetical protein
MCRTDTKELWERSDVSLAGSLLDASWFQVPWMVQTFYLKRKHLKKLTPTHDGEEKKHSGSKNSS